MPARRDFLAAALSAARLTSGRIAVLLSATVSGRNLSKPFGIAGFIAGEIYMLFTVLGPYGRETHPLPVPVPEVAAVEAGTPPPLGAKVSRVLVSAIFFGPFGAIAGTGVGLLVSGLCGDFKRKEGPSA